MAKNLINSLRSYKLVKKNGYDLTKIGSVLISSEKIYVDFAKQIIENLDGSKYLRAIELIKKDGIICTRNEQIIRKINIEYNTNYKTTTKYISSLKQWLIKGE